MQVCKDGARRHKAPFVCSPEVALVRITLSVKRLDDRHVYEEFALVTHRKSLVNLLRKFAPGSGSNHGVVNNDSLNNATIEPKERLLAGLAYSDGIRVE